MKEVFDLISIGDTTLDVFLEIDQASVQCDLNKSNCRICVNYADKIPVNKVTKVLGVGNAANIAVGSSRLKLKTGLYTILGKDSSGQEIYKKLKKEGIAMDYVQIDKSKGTNYSVVLNYKGERTIFVFHEHRKYTLPKFKKTKWIYYTSLAAGHKNLHKSLINFVKKNKVKLAFNPGTYQLKEGLKNLKPILKNCTVLIVNKEEAKKLFGKNGSIKILLKFLKQQGPEIVVITDGPNGSYALEGNKFYSQKIYCTKVIERTGCGDSYSTAFIGALILGKNIQEAMRWGTVNAAFVLKKIGAQKGLLKRKVLEKKIKIKSNFVKRKTKNC